MKVKEEKNEKGRHTQISNQSNHPFYKPHILMVELINDVIINLGGKK